MATTSPSETLILKGGIGRSSSATIGGIVVIVLTILGLAGVFPGFMAAVSVIALGVALLLEGAAVAAEYDEVLTRMDPGALQHAELSGGMSAEMLAGGGGVVLGLLALIGVAPAVLMPVAVILFGASVAIGSGVTHRLNHLRIANSGASEKVQHIAEEATSTVAGADVLIGLGALVLGILGLVGVAPMTVTLVALLSIGAVSLLTGSVLGAKMVNMFRARAR